MLPGNRFTSKLKYTGDRNAASYQGDFRFACVQDRGCRGTSRVPALSVLLMQEERGTVGFGAGGGAGVCVFRGGLNACLPQAMEFEEMKPQINADERRLNALSEEITCATHLSLFKY